MRCWSIACVLLALAAAGCDRGKPAPEQGGQASAGHPVAPSVPTPQAGKIDRSHAGSAMPAMPFAGPGGAPATLTAFRGRPVLVNLWATWCGPCVKELPTLDALAAREKGKLHVVAVSEDMGGPAQIAPFWQARHFSTLLPYNDGKMALMNALKVDSLPTTVLFDSKGREVWRVIGDKVWTGDDVKPLLVEAK